MCDMDCQSADMYFLKNLCSLCLRDDLESLTSIYNLDEKNISIQEKLKFCMAEMINIHLEIPRLICASCQQYLNFMFIFKQKCIENSIRLKEYFEKLRLNKPNDKFKNLAINISNLPQKNLKYSDITKNTEYTNAISTESSISSENCPLSVENIKTGDAGNEFADVNEKYDDIVIKEELLDIDVAENNMNIDDIDIKEEFIDYTENKNIYNEILFADEIKIKVERQDASNAVSVITGTYTNKSLNDDFNNLPNLMDNRINNNACKQAELIVAQNNSKLLQETSNSNKTIEENKKLRFKRMITDDLSDSDCSDTSSNEKDTNKFDISIMKRNEVTKKYHCFYCSNTYTKSTKLDIHMRKYHIEDKPFHCRYCPEKFQFRRKFNYHVLTHKDIILTCTFCGKKCADINSLRTHSKIHGEKTHHCQFCPKQFVRKIHLINHETTHTGEKLFACTHCNKMFSTKNNLDFHSRSHTGVRPYVCSICGKAFKDWKGHHYHMDMHAEVKRYTCDICSSKFRSASHLKIHTATHSDARPYVCTVCSKSYKKKSYLIEHLQKHGNFKVKRVMEKVECTVCEHFFGKGAGIIAHMKTHERKITSDI